MYCSTADALKEALQRASPWRLRTSADAMQFRVFDRWADVPSALWREQVKNGSAFLQPDYLQALCSSESEHFDLRFVMFYQNTQPCGIAVFKITTFDAPDVSSNLNDERPIIRWITRKLTPDTKHQHLLVCGNAFATGEHGFRFQQGISGQKAMDALCYAITALLDKLKQEQVKIAAVLVKDFYPHSFDHAAALGRCGFRPFKVDHNMMMPLDPAWKTKEDYLQSLVTKFRTKANAAFARSESLKMVTLSVDDISRQSAAINTLFGDVHNKADFKLGELSAEVFVKMATHMGANFRMYGYYLEEKLVGFRTTVLGTECMDAHMVGIDYSINKDYALYSRMLYDYIEEGIAAQVSRIVFGRTAGEIKSTVGALPVDLECCIRHPGKVSNLLLNLLFRYVQPSQFPVRQPYKKEVFEAQQQRLAQCV